jgi:aryl-alcohol dehydrogenase-like predicted oxidoreductase
MNNLIDRGLVFYWGTSEWSAQMIQEARDVANRLGLVPPYFDQTQYNMLHRDRIEVEYAPLYPQLGLTIWSPLAGGRLTDKTNRAPTKSRAGETVDPLVEKLQGVAKALGCNVAQLALAWSIANTNVSTAIFGSSSLAQVKQMPATPIPSSAFVEICTLLWLPFSLSWLLVTVCLISWRTTSVHWRYSRN